jgi:hypothetical protein
MMQIITRFKPNHFNPVDGIRLQTNFDTAHLRDLLQNKQDLVRHLTE